MTEQTIATINAAISTEISKLQIPIPQEQERLWKVKLFEKCVMREQMDRNEQALIEVNTKQWVTADDSLDFIVAHLQEEGFNNHGQSGYDFSKIGFDVNMKLLVLSNKKQAFNLVFEALEGVNVKVASVNEDYNRITREYFARHKNWGVNPDYRAMMIDYKVNIPCIQKPDYTVTD